MYVDDPRFTEYHGKIALGYAVSCGIPLRFVVKVELNNVIKNGPRRPLYRDYHKEKYMAIYKNRTCFFLFHVL